jgi:hypothetical protein
MAVDDQYTVSLLHFDGGLTDESSKVWTANNGAATNTNQSKFGEKSLYLNGTNQYISTPNNSDFDFGAGDFTVDWWEYRTSSSSYGAVLTRNRDSNLGPYVIGAINGSDLAVYMSSNGASWNIAEGLSMGSYILNAWTHYAFVRKGNTFYTFKNGILQNTLNSSVIFPAGSSPIALGYNNTYYFGGYIDEFRVSKGIARWTTDFTSPNAPYAPNTPSSPTNLTATAGESQVTLSWTAVTGATGYNVKRSTTVGGPYTTIATTVADTKYVDATVTNGTTYYYVVTAIDANGNESANSNEVSATPMSASKAILQVTMIDSSEREYRVSTVVIDGFINWYTRTIGTGISCYAIDDIVDDSKEYLSFEKIISFKVIPLAK